MEIIKANNLLCKIFDEQVIVFAPNTGQTHCLDKNVDALFQQLSAEKPTPTSQLKQFYLQDCQEHEKSMLNSYIQDMIDNLLKLKLIQPSA